MLGSKDKEQSVESMQQEILRIERSIDKFLERIGSTESGNILQTYERKLTKLEKEKALLSEKIEKCSQPIEDFEKTYRTAFEFLANPYERWVSEDILDKRSVLQLAFSKPIRYHRKVNTILGFRGFE